ncbi:hypothetical protein Tco_1410265 [Tanacetum coccineum]
MPVNAISMTQDVPSTSNCRLIELENQVQCLMEAHLAPNHPIQVNKISSSCEICSDPHNTQYFMEIPSKLLLNMHPCVPTKREVSGTLSSPSKIILVTPIIRHGKVTQNLVAGDGIAGIKRCRRDLSSDDVKYFTTASGRIRLKEDLESST